MKPVLFQKDFMKYFRWNRKTTKYQNIFKFHFENRMRKYGYVKIPKEPRYLLSSQPYSAVLMYPDHSGFYTKPPAKRAFVVRFIRAFKSAWNTM